MPDRNRVGSTDDFPNSDLIAEVIIASGMLSTRDSYNNHASAVEVCFPSWAQWSAADVILGNLLISETLFFEVDCFIIMSNQEIFGD